MLHEPDRDVVGARLAGDLALARLALLIVLLGAAGALRAQSETTDDSAVDEAPIDEITILGSREDMQRITGSAHRIDEEVLEEFKYDDINRVLNLVPGVYLREEDGYGLRPNIGLRGGSSDRSQKVTLLEDGVPVSPAPYSAPAAYYFPLTTRMVGVEVFKGPSAIQHGPQTIGGAINLVSAPVPERPSALFEVAAGSDAYRRVHGRVGSTWGDLGLSAEYVHLGSDGFKALDGGGDTGFDKNEAVVKGRYRIGPGTLELRLGYADEVSDETYLGLTEDDFRETPVRRYSASALDRMDWEWGGIRADWTQELFGGDLRLTGYRHAFDRAWNKFNNFRSADIRDVLANPDTPLNRLLYQTLTGERTSDPNTDADDLLIGTNAREFDVIGLQGSQAWDFTSGPNDRFSHEVEVGLRLHSDRIRRLHDQYAFEMISGELQRKDSTLAITADNTGSADALALWLRDEISFGRWTFVPGIRVEAVETTFVDGLARASASNDYTEVLPGLGLSYAWNDNLMLLGGVHKGFSPATPGLDPDVEPEEAVNWEGGLRWSGPYGLMESIFFYSDYSNLTAECTFSAGCSGADLGRQVNAGEVEITGVEAGWSYDVVLANELLVPIAVTYTFTNTEILEAFTSVNPQFGDVQPGYELPYVPRHRANASLGLVGSRWGTYLSATYQSRMRDQAGDGPLAADEGSDEFTVLDLSAYYDVSDALRLAARVDNLMDEDYIVARRPFGARPALPLNVQLSLTYRY